MRILVVPGLGGSGPDYWQSHWQRFGFWPTGERILDELVSEREVRARPHKEADAGALFDWGIEASGSVTGPRPAPPSWLFRTAQNDQP
jgi:hypothetical protein